MIVTIQANPPATPPDRDEGPLWPDRRPLGPRARYGGEIAEHVVGRSLAEYNRLIEIEAGNELPYGLA